MEQGIEIEEHAALKGCVFSLNFCSVNQGFGNYAFFCQQVMR